MYRVNCTNPDCPTNTELKYCEDDAIEEWNNTHGLRGMTLEDIINLRGVEKPDYDSVGVPKDNYWNAYYIGWREAYKDLKEIITQHREEILTEVIIHIEEN